MIEKNFERGRTWVWKILTFYAEFRDTSRKLASCHAFVFTSFADTGRKIRIIEEEERKKKSVERMQ